MPEGDEGFDILAAWGIRTIISVDGAIPDIEQARPRHIRYIHLPIGYNGFDEQRKLELVRATRDARLVGPVYIHCHHGKHRSAGAAATIAASLGWSTPQAMVARMKISGTSPSYSGLFACALNAVVIAPKRIDAVTDSFPESIQPQGLIRGMVEIDKACEDLMAIEAAGWRASPNHPGLVPAAEAGQIADLLRVLADSDSTESHPVDFSLRLRENGFQADELEQMLIANSDDATALSEKFRRVRDSCTTCHAQYRD